VEDRLSRALALALDPSELDPEVNERLIASAMRSTGAAEGAALPELVDDASLTAEASSRELADAAALRAALEGELVVTEHRALVGALVAAWRPAAVASATHDALIRRHARRASALRAALWPALGLAAAAAFVVAAWGPELRARMQPPRAPALELSLARSAAELFDPAEAFAQTGGESARIDRIGAARTAEFRANRFARWGVE
jgi:hypothetical protein